MAFPNEQTQFQPGQSGNPNGRPPGTQNSAVRLRRLLDAVQKAKHPVTKEEQEFTTLELMDAALITRALKGDVQAYREILDRFEGKVPTKNEHSGPGGGPIQTKTLVIELPPDDGNDE